MTERIKPGDAATRARLKMLNETPIPPAEFQELLSAPISDEEHEANRELIDWFMRRYPTPTDRLKYARRKYREWTAG